MQREKATDAKDLPHPYDGDTEGPCSVCDTPEDDPRHQAWDREHAAEQTPAPTFPRELGT